MRSLADLYEAVGGAKTDLVPDDDHEGRAGRGRARAAGRRGGGSEQQQEEEEEEDVYGRARQVSGAWSVMKGMDL